jgi:hypothetical protein
MEIHQQVLVFTYSQVTGWYILPSLPPLTFHSPFQRQTFTHEQVILMSAFIVQHPNLWMEQIN